MKLPCLALLLAVCALPSCANRAAGSGSDGASQPEVDPSRPLYLRVQPDSEQAGRRAVRALNQSQTRCADGALQTECIVELDSSKLALDEHELRSFQAALARGEIVVRGRFSMRAIGAVLGVDDAWQSAALAPTAGKYYLAHSASACADGACPAIQAVALNGNQELLSLAGLDFARAENAQTELDDAWAAVRADGVLFVGELEAVTSAAGSAERLRATQFFTPVKHRTVSGCHPSGCFGEVCVPADESVFSACESKAEHGCYQRFGSCERSADGNCAFSPSPELTACLARARR